jgi:hypothetical protein
MQPLDMKAGEMLAVALSSRTSLKAGTHVAWTATRADAKGRALQRQSMNLDKGFLP